MKLLHYYCIAGIILAGCNNNTKPASTAIDTAKKNVSSVAQAPADSLNRWPDTLVARYVSESNDEALRLARQNHTPIEWYADRLEYRNKNTYFVYQLGHTADEQLVVDHWLYIDSITKAMYIYDIVKDSLVKIIN